MRLLLIRASSAVEEPKRSHGQGLEDPAGQAGPEVEEQGPGMAAPGLDLWLPPWLGWGQPALADSLLGAGLLLWNSVDLQFI